MSRRRRREGPRRFIWYGIFTASSSKKDGEEEIGTAFIQCFIHPFDIALSVQYCMVVYGSNNNNILRSLLCIDSVMDPPKKMSSFLFAFPHPHPVFPNLILGHKSVTATWRQNGCVSYWCSRNHSTAILCAEGFNSRGGKGNRHVLVLYVTSSENTTPTL